MELVERLFGKTSPNREEFIRCLVKKRIREDSLAESLGYNESMVDSLGTMEIMGIPEAAVVTIVETYAKSLKVGTPEEAILYQIENHRSQIGSGALPNPLNLESYIKYRIKIEHGRNFPISENCISYAIAISREYYGC